MAIYLDNEIWLALAQMHAGGHFSGGYSTLAVWVTFGTHAHLKRSCCKAQSFHGDMNCKIGCDCRGVMLWAC